MTQTHHLYEHEYKTHREYNKTRFFLIKMKDKT